MGIQTDEIKNKLINTHASFSSELEKKGITKPFTKYFALAVFDGDHLGKWLTGDEEKLSKGDNGRLNLEQFHQDFTKAIREFAEAVDKEFEYDSSIPGNKGKLVYAGGEDFMVLLNIHHLFESLKWIRDTYNTMVNEKLKLNIEHYRFAKDQNMTISLGVAIAHYKTPLSDTVAKAHQTEQLAKKAGRNCFAISTHKHSGGRHQLVLPWGVGDGTLELLNNIQKLITGNGNDKPSFSPAFIRKICDALFELGYDLNNNLVHSNIKLYVAQASTDNNPNNIKDLVDYLIELQGIGNKTADQTQRNKNFAEALMLLDFINRKSDKGE